MPNLDFPEWLSVGSVVASNVNQNEYVITRIQFIPSETLRGRYEIDLNRLAIDDAEGAFTRPQRTADRVTTGLLELVSGWRFTGDCMLSDERVISTGTTMPVTMHARAVLPGEAVHIQGAGTLDGVYRVDESNPSRIVISRTDPHTAAAQEVFTTSFAYDPRLFLGVPITEPDPRTGVPMTSAGLPVVGADQVWLLPPPNTGLWRVSIDLSDGVTPVHLTHARERDRFMRTGVQWLVQNGVRQEPVDPRTVRRDQTILVGQVWEFGPQAEPRSRYQRTPRWRVREVHDRSERVMLVSEDGAGKRIYLLPQDLLTQATCLGEGLPRRTSFERLLEDDSEQ